MKIKINQREVEAKFLHVEARVRYWEDTEINGVEDTDDGQNVPCKSGDSWCPTIDLDTGKITNWEIGKMLLYTTKYAMMVGIP